MADEVIRLRGESGSAYTATVGTDSTVTVGGLTLRVQPAPDGSMLVTGNGHAVTWSVVIGDTRWVFVEGEVFTFDIERPSRRRRAATSHHATLTAPMPATVRRLQAATGDAVRKGDVLIVLEAMKMELPIRAPADGRVEKINYREGSLVQPGVSLIEFEEDAQ